MGPTWFRRLLALLPLAIAVLWVAGVAHFRGRALTPFELLVVAAAAAALSTLGRRLRPPRPLPALPAGSNPVALATIAAALVGGLAALFGGVFELVLEPHRPSETSWALRTAWHAACAFAASYCGFLRRLGAAAAPAAPKPPGDA
ncbi:MAG: hypothetical protein KF830_04875 [Planctomycetes bacterium]|nr:hypothetical protein [Planctomycetota bacterium]